jgi:peptide methionine sulfoxide reductase MsrA
MGLNRLPVASGPTSRVQRRKGPASTFNDAEDYHQRYFEKHGGAACATTLR